MRYLLILISCLFVVVIATSCGSSTGEDNPGSSGSSSGSGSSSSSSSSSSGSGSSSSSGSSSGFVVPETLIPLSCSREYVSAAGIKYCVTKVGSVEGKVALPDPMPKKVTLVTHLHADRAINYTNDNGYDELAKWALDNNMIFFAPEAPNTCGSWWLREEDCTQGVGSIASHVHVKPLFDFFERLHKAYPIDQSQYFFSSISGGGVFLTNGFLTKYADKFPGIYALNSGASPWSPPGFNEKILEKLTLHFTWGSEDFLDSRISTTAVIYGRKGCKVIKNKLMGVSHFIPNSLSVIVDVWSKYE